MNIREFCDLIDDPTDEMEDHFTIVEDTSLKLYKQYQDSGSDKTYVAWLEETVLSQNELLLKWIKKP